MAFDLLVYVASVAGAAARAPRTTNGLKSAGLLLVALAAAACDGQATTAIASFCAQEKTECAAVQTLCEVAAGCEGMQLLVGEEECSKQLAEALFPASMAEHARLCRVNKQKENKCAQASVRIPTRVEKDVAAACQVCVTSISCEGLAQIASGEIKLTELCSACAGVGSLASGGGVKLSYAVLPIIAAAPAASGSATVEVSATSAPAIPAPSAALPAAPASASASGR